MVAGSLAEAGPGTEWRSKPAYSNSLAYQPSLLQMTAKTDAERRQMTGAENARYAKLEIDK